MAKCEMCDVELVLMHPPSQHLLECPECKSVYNMNLSTKEITLVDNKHE